MEATRCQSCKLLPYRHRGVRAGVKQTLRRNGKWETDEICKQYNPTLTGKKIMFGGLWSRFLLPQNRKKK